MEKARVDAMKLNNTVHDLNISVQDELHDINNTVQDGLHNLAGLNNSYHDLDNTVHDLNNTVKAAEINIINITG